MDRRDFLKISAAGVAATAVAPNLLAEDVFAGTIVPGAIPVDGKAGDVTNGVAGHLDVKGYVKEPARKIPVVGEADVVVVGGGAAGFAAAVSAARQGASVILVEKANFLGGLWTGGLVLPVLATHARGKGGDWEKATGGICMEVCDELLANGWADNPDNPRVDPEATKYLLDRMILDAGIRILYNSTVCGVTMSGDRIESVLIDCNTGRIALKCKMVVDASGDGCVFNFAGDPHEDRRYHISTSYRTGGCDNSKCGWNTPNPQMKFRTVGTRKDEDGLDVFRVSELQQKHRIEVWNRVEELKKDPECKDVFLMECAPVTGVRVTRVLDSLCNVTLEGSMEWQSYEDCIGMSGICDPFIYKGRKINKTNRPVWQIPYRALVPRQTRNLLVAGRCFGYDAGITWDAREISTCMVTGEAAGVGAALASASRCAARDVDVPRLQAILRAGNVRLDF